MIIKTLVPLLFVIIISASCGSNAQDADSSVGLTDSLGVANIEFRSQRHDFGNVKHGEKLVYTFKYRNTGDIPLVIYSARADCGCTVPEYDDEPIAPGKEGNLKVVFDTRGFQGYQTKTIHVTTNAGFQTLAIRAVVE